MSGERPVARRVVVGGAIVRDGRVLAARRTTPSAAAGRWEFPGGKVEPGESVAEGLVRELAEELGVEVEVTGWLAGSARIGTTHELRVATVRLRSGTPSPAEHDELRWLASDELDSVEWLEPDRPFLDELAEMLADGEPARAIFYDETDARSVARRLIEAGHAALVERERLAGEDDDEAHPWAVLSQAPRPLLESLAEESDGWLDAAVEAGGPPLDLPSAPRRIKRPGENRGVR